MPRLLNFIVAIYLIFVGLVGLGVLKMFAYRSAGKRGFAACAEPLKVV